MKIERIAFIGFGEAGQTISRGLLGAGAAGIRAYDILPQALAAAGALGAQVAKDHVDAVREADIVFLAVTASSSLQAAQACVPGLRKGQLFLDINSVSPQRKIDTAACVAPSGALYVDVAVMAPVAPYLHKVPCLIGGPGAQALLPRARLTGHENELKRRVQRLRTHERDFSRKTPAPRPCLFPVATTCSRPCSRISIATASSSSRGFPSRSPSTITTVSLPMIAACGWRAAIATVFSRASRSACATGSSDGNHVSSMSAGMVSKLKPSICNSCARRGDCDARISFTISAPAAASQDHH
jgi:hypothetical protein